MRERRALSTRHYVIGDSPFNGILNIKKVRKMHKSEERRLKFKVFFCLSNIGWNYLNTRQFFLSQK